MLDLYKLKIFTTVVQAGSFSAAAETLYMTQSAVSQHMGELESTVGRSLFQRGWRGVTPTTHGEVLYGYARRIFALVAEAENAVIDVAQLREGQVNIGATPGVGAYMLPDWAQGFGSRYPKLTISIQTGITTKIVRDVLESRLELGFIEGELDDLKTNRLNHIVLQQVEQFVVVGRDHPWWSSDHIQLESLTEQSFIMRQRSSQSRNWIEQTLSAHHIQPKISMELDNIESIKRTVTSGMCITILPEYVIRSEEQMGQLHRIAVDNVKLSRDLKMVWDKDAAFTPITRAFIRYLEQYFPHLKDFA
jgi:LysR family transcriptional regulator, low CO2-responsive transcriptional regulator